MHVDQFEENDIAVEVRVFIFLISGLGIEIEETKNKPGQSKQHKAIKANQLKNKPNQTK